MPSTPPRRAPKWKSPSVRSQPEGDENVAILRRTADEKGDQLTIRFGSAADTHLHLTGPNGTILEGLWTSSTTCQKKSLLPEDEWDETCWHSDEDADYLEIQQTLTNGWRAQRQFLLARNDRFLFLAEAILGPNAPPVKQRIDYQASFQLPTDVTYHGAKESYEGLFRKGKRTLATVLPPGLPEWRSDHFPGKLEAAGDQLKHSTAVEGANLYAPLFIDLHPARFKQLVTWRRLTVGEQLEPQSRDVAVGYRVQVGGFQWLFYRALSARGNRTVLGYNTAYEFGCQRFQPNGTLETVLEIE